MVNYLIDNNLPPALARAINELCKNHYDARVYALKDRYPANTRDIDWITDLGSQENWVIISQDRFAKGEAEKMALRDSGLTVFFLAKQWSTEKYWNKSHNLVRWWPSIMEQAERMKGAAAFKVGWRHGNKAKFEQVKI